MSRNLRFLMFFNLTRSDLQYRWVSLHLYNTCSVLSIHRWFYKKMLCFCTKTEIYLCLNLFRGQTGLKQCRSPVSIHLLSEYRQIPHFRLKLNTSRPLKTVKALMLKSGYFFVLFFQVIKIHVCLCRIRQMMHIKNRKFV